MINLIKNIVIAFLLAILFVGFQNCSGDHNGTGNAWDAPSTVDVGQLQAAAVGVMSERCANCHNPTTNADLETPINNILDINALLFDAYIIPGEPQSSPLYLMAVDGLMPHGAEATDLNEFELETLREWIVALADNSVDADIIPPSDGENDSGSPPTFADVQVILNARCVSCHRVGGQKSDLPLQNEVQVLTIVTPGNAGGSLLYQEIRGTNPTMPVGSPLTSRQVSTIRQWINSLDDEN